MVKDSVLGLELLVLILIFFQDVKYRAVNWPLFVVLGLSGLILSLQEVGLRNTLLNALMNNGVLLVELVSVYFYFSLRTGLKTGFINKKMGMGDIIMLSALSFAFSPVNYTAFVLISLIISLLIAGLLRKSQTVPLAGYMGLCYFIFLVLNHFILNYNTFLANPVIR